MSKNDKLINAMKEVARRNRQLNTTLAAEEQMPQIYSAIAIALWDCLEADNDEDRLCQIYEVFNRSQEVWQEHPKDICEYCIEHTTIDVRTKRQVDKSDGYATTI